MSAVVEPTLNFRPVCEDDLEQVLNIEDRVYEFPWSKNIFRDCLRVGYNCWLLEEFNTIISYGIMSIAVGECHILNLCVEPQRQNQGYGKVMLEFLLDTAMRFHSDTAFLEVRPSNTSAIQLYLEAGFDEVGIRKGYYPATTGREDGLILAKTLLKPE